MEPWQAQVAKAALVGTDGRGAPPAAGLVFDAIEREPAAPAYGAQPLAYLHRKARRSLVVGRFRHPQTTSQRGPLRLPGPAQFSCSSDREYRSARGSRVVFRPRGYGQARATTRRTADEARRGTGRAATPSAHPDRPQLRHPRRGHPRAALFVLSRLQQETTTSRRRRPAAGRTDRVSDTQTAPSQRNDRLHCTPHRPVSIRPRRYTATFDTTAGTVDVKLDTTTTPNTTNDFVVLARYHYYDNTTLFRTARRSASSRAARPHQLGDRPRSGLQRPTKATTMRRSRRDRTAQPAARTSTWRATCHGQNGGTERRVGPVLLRRQRQREQPRRARCT